MSANELLPVTSSSKCTFPKIAAPSCWTHSSGDELNFLDETNWTGRRTELSEIGPTDETFRIGTCVVNGRTGLIEAPGNTTRLRRKGVAA